MVVFWEFTFTIYFVNFGILNVINKEHNVELIKIFQVKSLFQLKKLYKPNYIVITRPTCLFIICVKLNISKTVITLINETL